jgi:hypothetical protein
MPMNVIRGEYFRGYVAVGRELREAAQTAISKIKYADIFRGAGSIAHHGTVRVDNQGRFQIGGVGPYYCNIQVQISNLTVAHASICETIMNNDPLSQTGAKNRVISSLQQSLDDGHSYTVTGGIP